MHAPDCQENKDHAQLWHEVNKYEPSCSCKRISHGADKLSRSTISHDLITRTDCTNSGQLHLMQIDLLFLISTLLSRKVLSNIHAILCLCLFLPLQSHQTMFFKFVHFFSSRSGRFDLRTENICGLPSLIGIFQHRLHSDLQFIDLISSSVR